MQQKTESIKSVYHCIYSVCFWQFFFLMLFSNYFGTFFMYVYKTYGENKQAHEPISDSLLTWAASIGAGLVNGFSRITLGALYDSYGFKKLFTILMLVQLFVSLICFHAANIPWLYFLCILLNYMSIGGMFALFPTSVTRVFGSEFGPQVYVWVLLGCFLASLVNTFNTIWLIKVMGIQALFYLGSVAQVITLGILYFFEERLDVENLAKHNALKTNYEENES